MRQTYVIGRGRAKRSQPTVICGGCESAGKTTVVPVNEAYKIRIPVGRGGTSFDNRPITPTGGRLGNPSFGKRGFVKTETRWGCVSCSLKFSIAKLPGRDDRFLERCKAGKR